MQPVYVGTVPVWWSSKPPLSTQLLSASTLLTSLRGILMQSTDTVYQLKQTLESNVRKSPSQQELSFWGTAMEDGNTLQSYGVEYGARLTLTYQ